MYNYGTKMLDEFIIGTGREVLSSEAVQCPNNSLAI